ncbi:MarR family winged helix-turn-helix transcriptional regulator [uncultured Roseobacter sp.]|uniref:MarR family winged helix-turn-helix transcriptional regulator n=1 Tax=uncultured Roseobacter sp. TaxID=114847 RepID=UPI002602DC65|nr:MarR family winged helix-turn-helix transcriptional regulator [uncultured Roseobacter sp.]
MSIKTKSYSVERDPVSLLFGPLSVTMLHQTELSDAWRINFIANFFTGPLYGHLQEEFDLSRAGFVILFSLSQSESLVARDICQVTGLPKNSISRAISDLQKRGLVERRIHPVDKRAKPLALTKQGSALLTDVLPTIKARQAAMLSPLTKTEKAQFDELVVKILSAMPQWVPMDSFSER